MHLPGVAGPLHVNSLYLLQVAAKYVVVRNGQKYMYLLHGMGMAWQSCGCESDPLPRLSHSNQDKQTDSATLS